jgi:DNA-directed RNA polymerase specialized sigma24 family protein
MRLAYLLLGERALAEDVAQDSFLLAYRYINRFHAGRAFAPWLFRIVTNIARQRLRSARRRREVSLDALLADNADSSFAYSAFQVDTPGEIDPVARGTP